MSWEEITNQDTIDWLLEEENPSIRYWTLQQLQDKPESNPEVMKAQDKVMDSPCIKAILDAQKKEGHWGNLEDMYLPKYRAPTHNLLILAELGAKKTKGIEAAIEHLFLFQRDSGHFLTKMPKTAKGRASKMKDGCCLDGNILFYLIHFGYLGDSRTQRLIDFQIDYHSEDVGGWNCRAFPIEKDKVFPVNCYMGAVKMLKGLVQIPIEKRPSSLQKIFDREVEVILENEVYRYLRNPDGTRKEKAGWKRFGFPLFYQSDVLEVLDVLTKLGVKDERMQDSIDLILSHRGDDGKWLLKNTYNGKMFCEIDEKNKVSKWITLRALRVLRRYYS
jgi:hypothetical protein